MSNLHFFDFICIAALKRKISIDDLLYSGSSSASAQTATTTLMNLVMQFRKVIELASYGLENEQDVHRLLSLPARCVPTRNCSNEGRPNRPITGSRSLTFCPSSFIGTLFFTSRFPARGTCSLASSTSGIRKIHTDHSSRPKP